jgi:hypothetical protein
MDSALALPAVHFYHEGHEDREEKRRVLTADYADFNYRVAGITGNPGAKHRRLGVKKLEY